MYGDEYKNDELYQNPFCTNEVVIPSSINGGDVTRIGDRAFYEKSLVSVEFPTTIKEIGKLAFANNDIFEVNLLNVETIEDNAFIIDITFGAGIEEVNIGSSFSNAGVAPFSSLKSLFKNMLI